MDYALLPLHLSNTVQINLTKASFDEICRAQTFILEYVYIEEKFDGLYENYYELEKELIDIASKHMLFGFLNQDMRNQVALLNRRTLNFLSSAKTYTDHTKGHLSRLFGQKSDEYLKFDGDLEILRNNSLSFKALEALRNYSQHAGYPIAGMSVGTSKSLEPFLLTHDVKIRICIDDLRKDRKIDKRLINSLKELEGGDQLKPLLRRYMEEIALLHDQLRETLASHASIHDGVTYAALASWKSEFTSDRDPVGLAIISYEEDKIAVETQYLMVDEIDRRHIFQRKNCGFTNLSFRTISS